MLALEQCPAYPEANEKLGLSMDAPLIHLSRLRSADNTPLVLVDTYLPYNAYYKLMDVDFSRASLYGALEELCGIRVNRVVRELEAVNAPRKDAELLQISQNKAMCLVKTLAYAPGLTQPQEFSVARYRGDLNKFNVEINR